MTMNILNQNGSSKELSWQSFIEGVKANSPVYKSVEFKETLTPDQLKELKDALDESYNKRIAEFKETLTHEQLKELKDALDESYDKRIVEFKKTLTREQLTKLQDALDEFKETLTREQLTKLQDALGKKDAYIELGYIKWAPGQEGTKEVDDHLAENNRRYQPYPNDFVYAWLSRGAYGKDGYTFKTDVEAVETINFKGLESNKTVVTEALKGWKVKKYWDHTEESGYFSVLYVNDKTHQAVLAVRGSESKGKELFSFSYKDWATDFNEVIGGAVVAEINGRTSQQPHNFEAFRQTLNMIRGKKEGEKEKEEEKEKKSIEGYNLSFTGHSLGGWLASMCVFHANRKGVNQVKAVTFDSPGTLEMMEKMQPNVQASKLDIRALDITTYLMSPNVVNTANHHVGKVYCLDYPSPIEQDTKKWFDRLKDYLKSAADWFGEFALGKLTGSDDKDENKALYDVFKSTAISHPMESILPLFASNEDLLKRATLMKDWPSLNIIRKETGGPSRIKQATSYNSMALQVSVVFQDYFDGKIKDEQLITARKLLSQNGYGSPLSKRFMKQFIAHFSKAKQDQGATIYTLDVAHNTVDQRLYGLWQNRQLVQNKIKHVLDDAIRIQFRELVSLYTIDQAGGTWNLKRSDSGKSIDFSEIRSRMERLLSVIPQDLVDMLTGYAQSISLTEWLPHRMPSIVEENKEVLRTYYNQELHKAFSNSGEKAKVVVLYGKPGMGKTSVAAQYLIHCKQGGDKVRWLRASSETQLKTDCIKLAEDLGVPRGLDLTQMKLETYKKLKEAGEITIVLDNAEDKQAVEFILNTTDKLPSNINVIVTTRNEPGKGEFLNGTPIKVEGFTSLEARQYLDRHLSSINGVNDKKLLPLLEQLKLADSESYSPLELRSITTIFRRYEPKTVEGVVSELIEYKKKVDNRPATSLLLSKLSEREREMLRYFALCDVEMIPYAVVEKIRLEKKEKVIKHLLEDRIIEHGDNESYRMHKEVLTLVDTAIERENEKYASMTLNLEKIAEAGMDNKRYKQEAGAEIRSYLDAERRKSQDITEAMIKIIAELLPAKLEDYSYGPDVEKSRRLLATAVSVSKHADRFLIKNPALCKLLMSIAYSYKVTFHDCNTAEQYAKRALRMAEAMHYVEGYSHQVAQSYKCLGAIYTTKCDDQKAVEYVGKALTILRQVHNHDNAELAEYLNDYSVALLGVDKIQEAYLSCKEAVELRKEMNAKNSGDVETNNIKVLSIYLTNLARLCIIQAYHQSGDAQAFTQKIEEADSLLQEVKQQLFQKDGTTPNPKITDQTRIARYYVINAQLLFVKGLSREDKREETLGKALVSLKEVEKIRALIYGDVDHHTIVVDHYVKAQIKHALGDEKEKYDIAFKAFQMAVNLSENQTVKRRYITDIQRLILEMVADIPSHYRERDRVTSSKPLESEVIEEIKQICRGSSTNAKEAEQKSYNAVKTLAAGIKQGTVPEQPTDTQKALFFELFNIITLKQGVDTDMGTTTTGIDSAENACLQKAEELVTALNAPASTSEPHDTQKLSLLELCNIIKLNRDKFAIHNHTTAMNLALNIAPEAARNYPQFFLNGRVVDHYIKTLQDAGKHSEAELIREKVQYQKTVEK